jgi:hypothetical protein
VSDKTQHAHILNAFFTEKALPVGFPQIIQNPAMKVVEKARHAVLVCEASGSPKPTITWIKDTMPINLKANPRLNLMKQGKLRGKAAVERKITWFLSY